MNVTDDVKAAVDLDKWECAGPLENGTTGGGGDGNGEGWSDWSDCVPPCIDEKGIQTRTCSDNSTGACTGESERACDLSDCSGG